MKLFMFATYFLGDIPSYSTKPAHVIQTPSMTKRDTDDLDAVHYMIQIMYKVWFVCVPSIFCLAIMYIFASTHNI